MSKINIESILENKEKNHKFQGKGIKKGNQIIYLDEKVQTKITLDSIITIERKTDYYLKLNLKKGIKTKGLYINNYGTFEIETLTTELIKKDNELKIVYKIKINENEFDTFIYKLKFSLDT